MSSALPAIMDSDRFVDAMLSRLEDPHKDDNMKDNFTNASFTVSIILQNFNSFPNYFQAYCISSLTPGHFSLLFSFKNTFFFYRVFCRIYLASIDNYAIQ